MAILKTKLVTATPVVWSILGVTEHLSNGGFDSDTLWTLAGDFTGGITGGKCVYTHSSGQGSIFQSNANLAVALTAGQRHKLTYTISDSDPQGGFLFLTRFDTEVGPAGGAVAISADDGDHEYDFIWPSEKGGFALGAFSSVAGATFKIDDVSMTVFEEGVVFNGFILATLTHASITTFYLNGDNQHRVPPSVKIPIKDGVISTDVQLFQNAQVSPTGTTYTFKWYDLNNTLQATVTDITLDADEETITPPALEA